MIRNWYWKSLRNLKNCVLKSPADQTIGRDLLSEIITSRRLQSDAVAERQHEVFEFVLRNSQSVSSPNFSSISTQDLGLLFQVTDELFLDGQLSRTCEQKSQSPLKFRLSKRMTSSGGMTTMVRDRKHRTEFEIAIGTTPLFQSFQSGDTAKVGGVVCRNRLEALQRIMEHEMIHLAEMLLWDDSNCAARRFKTISNSFFRHRESNHQLLTPKDVARRNYQIRTGDKVAFRVNGKRRSGFVNRITKRATVLVADDSGTLYDDGTRYLKFYVPVNQLRKIA